VGRQVDLLGLPRIILAGFRPSRKIDHGLEVPMSFLSRLVRTDRAQRG
jgi:hypothetical protein